MTSFHLLLFCVFGDLGMVWEEATGHNEGRPADCALRSAALPKGGHGVLDRVSAPELLPRTPGQILPRFCRSCTPPKSSPTGPRMPPDRPFQVLLFRFLRLFFRRNSLMGINELAQMNFKIRQQVAYG